MDDDPEEVRRTRFLLTNLVIITIFIITLIFLIAAYPVLLAPDPTPDPTQMPSPGPSWTPSPSFPTRLPTLTPAPTRTPRETLTPSVTPTPTETGTPTPTVVPLGPPTLTPARPLENNDLYDLRTWTADQAGTLIEMLNAYPYLLPESARGEDNAAFYQAFGYAAYAQREALLRFPDAPQAPGWRWGLAYNLAASGDELAGQAYATLIVDALNQEQTNLRDLSLWFTTQEPRLALDLIPLAPVSGYLSSHLAQVHGAGSAFIWLLETSGGFQATVLAGRFDFERQPQAASVIADLTGDGREDAALYFSRPEDSFEFDPPLVFDLGQVPPVELPFQPVGAAFPMGLDFENFWAVAPAQAPDTGLPQSGSPENALLFTTTVFPACPVTVERPYTWNGSYFVPGEASFSLEPNLETLSYCRFIAEHAAQVWGPGVAVQLMKPVLPDWPPELDEAGEPFPADAQDEWRYRMGTLYALSGQVEEARQMMSGIVAEPAVPLSRWIEPAQEFLDLYRSDREIYPACAAAEFCRPADAIRYLVETLALEDSGQVIEALYQHGVTLRATGFFDFDLDGETERWFTVRHHPAEKLEFWILAPGVDRIHALEVASVVSDVPALSYFDEEQQPVEVWLDDVTAFHLLRDPVTRQPYVETFEIDFEWRNPFLEGLAAAQEALFSGADPEQVQRDLLRLEEDPGLMCQPYWTCDPYFYTLGLAGELAGDEIAARDAYLRVWWDYSRSPFTTMARMKLSGGGILPSATPTPTRTGVPLLTATPTPTSGTGTPAVTPSGTPATLTPSPTSENGDAYP